METHDFDWVLKVAHVVVYVYCALGCTKEDGSAVRRPLDNFELDLELFTPKARSLNRTYNNCAIFVDDADFFAVGRPAHVGDDTLVAIVNHLFVPVLFVQHPDNNQTLFVRRGKLLVLVVPLNDNNVALMALKVLIHRQVAATLALSGL